MNSLTLNTPASSAADRRRILVVEDDEDIRSLLSTYLGDNGFKVMLARDGKQMDEVLASAQVDLIVLDVNLPDEDGFSICMRLRNTGSPPLIMLTARGEDTDRILGIELGADDYLVKPFVPRELLARIGAVLRRTAPDLEPSPQFSAYSFSGFLLDSSARRLLGPTGVRVILTSAEFDLLLTLCRNPGKIFSRDELKASSTTERSVDILISRLRQKIEDDPRDPALIQTVRSMGYTFRAKVTSK
ncbi:response regulator [Methylocystis sp. L43]|uniref:response regulator n=1 Tax=unclassified Methylocystis TaxID=2625913 RepID=UPI0018C2457A|nr:response regulator [Methylocystis sp. L43]MBG0805902.1 response regulator [Methylocystis sp. H15]